MPAAADVPQPNVVVLSELGKVALILQVFNHSVEISIGQFLVKGADLRLGLELLVSLLAIRRVRLRYDGTLFHHQRLLSVRAIHPRQLDPLIPNSTVVVLHLHLDRCRRIIRIHLMARFAHFQLHVRLLLLRIL